MVVETLERAVNPDRLNTIVRERLHAHDRVCCRHQHRVRTVQRTPNGFKVEATSQRNGTWTAEAPGLRLGWHREGRRLERDPLRSVPFERRAIFVAPICDFDRTDTPRRLFTPPEFTSRL